MGSLNNVLRKHGALSSTFACFRAYLRVLLDEKENVL